VAQRSLAPLLVMALLLACSQQESAPQPPASAAPAASAPAPAPAGGAMAQAEAAKVFEQRCTTCHGPQGAGDGPASAGLTPRPRNFQDPEWQKSVTDEHIDQIIQYGGAAVGRSPMMPANPDLSSKPEVVTALRQHVRELSK
jgi:mono/diheme cytochrome c family protein